MGIEPTFVAWEATVLPLYDARLAHLRITGAGPLEAPGPSRKPRRNCPCILLVVLSWLALVLHNFLRCGLVYRYTRQ
jgi:hypothetical protein